MTAFAGGKRLTEDSARAARQETLELPLAFSAQLPVEREVGEHYDWE